MTDKEIKFSNELYKQATEVLGEEFWKDITAMIPNSGPRIDIYYTSTTVVVLAEIPQLQSPDQIGILLDGQTLVLEGELPCPYPVTDNRIAQKERFFGTFRRNLQLPKPVCTEGMKAKYSQGLLIIELQAEQTQQTNIPIDFFG